VTLVDLKRTPVEEITTGGIRTSAGHHPLDVIVYATGYDALTGPLEALRIRGRGGRALADAWREGPRTYLGLAVPGFPNLFTITGPGSPSVLSNMPVSIEQHVEWIGDCLAWLRAQEAEGIEATGQAAADWTNHVQEVAGHTLHPKVASWYMGANIPGKPRVFLPYIGGVGAYRDRCAAIAARGYEGFTVVPALASSRARS
jgi:cyclohexanone monooxygenase